MSILESRSRYWTRLEPRTLQLESVFFDFQVGRTQTNIQIPILQRQICSMEQERCIIVGEVRYLLIPHPIFTHNSRAYADFRRTF
jgi:hypothetical protein